MSKARPQTVIENAIAKADSSYFFENYTKQAAAVLDALDKAGYALIPKELEDGLWKKVAEQMKTGAVKPADHVKDVYQTVIRVAGK